jgi:hypothetical protein
MPTPLTPGSFGAHLERDERYYYLIHRIEKQTKPWIVDPPGGTSNRHRATHDLLMYDQGDFIVDIWFDLDDEYQNTDPSYVGTTWGAGDLPMMQSVTNYSTHSLQIPEMGFDDDVSAPEVQVTQMMLMADDGNPAINSWHERTDFDVLMTDAPEPFDDARFVEVASRISAPTDKRMYRTFRPASSWLIARGFAHTLNRFVHQNVQVETTQIEFYDSGCEDCSSGCFGGCTLSCAGTCESDCGSGCSSDCTGTCSSGCSGSATGQI